MSYETIAVANADRCYWAGYTTRAWGFLFQMLLPLDMESLVSTEQQRAVPCSWEVLLLHMLT